MKTSSSTDNKITFNVCKLHFPVAIVLVRLKSIPKPAKTAHQAYFATCLCCSRRTLLETESTLI